MSASLKTHKKKKHTHTYVMYILDGWIAHLHRLPR